MKRLLLLLSGLTLLSACPGELENPDRFQTNTDGGIASLCTLNIDVEVDIFMMKCSGDICHGGGAQNPPSGGVDLIAMGIEERLLDVPATGCQQRPLVDTSTVDESVLMKRIGGASECGAAMPLGTNGLSAAERDCVKAWILEKIDTSTAGAN